MGKKYGSEKWGTRYERERMEGKEKCGRNRRNIQSAFIYLYRSFFIDLLNDSYNIISSPEPVISILKGISSAQRAINYAIQNTVSRKELLDVLTFVNLTTLPDRLQKEKCLNIDYQGSIAYYGMERCGRGFRKTGRKLAECEVD